MVVSDTFWNLSCVCHQLLSCRTVAEEQRTLALGIQSVIFRLFGTFPGPIIFGAIFDSACIYWQYECNRRGNCWVYDNTQLSHRAVALAIAGVVANFLFSFLCWVAYPRGNKQNGEEKTLEDNSSHSDLNSSHTVQGGPLHGTVIFDRMESRDVLLNSVDHNDDFGVLQEEAIGSDASLHSACVRSVDSSGSPVRVLESPTTMEEQTELFWMFAIMLYQQLQPLHTFPLYRRKYILCSWHVCKFLLYMYW